MYKILNFSELGVLEGKTVTYGLIMAIHHRDGSVHDDHLPTEFGAEVLFCNDL